MVRIAVIGMVVFSVVVFGVAASLPGPADAQDDTDGRLSGVETSVADQGTEVAGLRRRVQRLERAVLTPTAAATTADTTRQGSSADGECLIGCETITIAGVGTAVSEKFTLTVGRYRVTATLEVATFSGFICHLHTAGGDEESLFNEIIDQPQSWTGSTVVTVREPGEAFVEVSNTNDPWTLTFERF